MEIKDKIIRSERIIDERDSITKENIRNISFFILAAILIIFLLVTMVYSKRDQEKIVGIHIKGEVNLPGYYEFKTGKKVVDAVEKAGGATENAYLDGVNLAQQLLDGEEIIIPAKDEQASSQKKVSSNDTAAATTVMQNTSSGEEKININTADMYLLCQLDGIGEAYAQGIINYRKSNGGFKSIEELKNIRGIGSAKFEKIKDKVTV